MVSCIDLAKRLFEGLSIACRAFKFKTIVFKTIIFKTSKGMRVARGFIAIKFKRNVATI